MASNELIPISGMMLMIVISMIKVHFSTSTRIAKMESHASVCDEKHNSHASKFDKQNEINIKAESYHVEVMEALAGIKSDIKYMSKAS